MKTIGHLDHGKFTLLGGAAQERKVYYSYLTPEEQVALPARVAELEQEKADFRARVQESELALQQQILELQREAHDLKMQLGLRVAIREDLRDALEKFESVWGSPLAGDVQAAGRQVVMAYRAVKESEL